MLSCTVCMRVCSGSTKTAQIGCSQITTNASVHQSLALSVGKCYHILSVCLCLLLLCVRFCPFSTFSSLPLTNILCCAVISICCVCCCTDSPLTDCSDLLTAYHRRMVDEALPLSQRYELARAWTAWETVLSYMWMVGYAVGRPHTSPSACLRQLIGCYCLVRC